MLAVCYLSVILELTCAVYHMVNVVKCFDVNDTLLTFYSQETSLNVIKQKNDTNIIWQKY